MNNDHEKALSKTKIKLMTTADMTFFMTVCFSLRYEWDDKIPTACTDGRTITFNPSFFMGLSEEERLFILLHETMHVAYLHMARLQDRDIRKWNIAADYVINLQLVDRKLKMPKGGLCDEKWRDMSAEEVYKALPDDLSVECDLDILPGEEGQGGEKLVQDVQDILVRAAVASRMSSDKPGSIPGDIEIFLNKLLNPELPWNRLLQKYLNAFCKNDYSFRKPNRRFFPKHHMPSLTGEKLMNLSIAVDTSGSVSDADFLKFISEVASILRMMKPEKITLVQFDTTIKAIDTIKDLKDLQKCKFKGRGGTRIDPVMDWAIEEKPQLLMVFSDGYFDPAHTPPPGELLWMIHNNEQFKAPFGKTIHYKIA